MIEICWALKCKFQDHWLGNPALKSNIDDFALYQGHKMFLSMDMFQCGLNFEISNGIAIS